jgi:antitoxin (DNA-binding transcriptional repressor) of toxin-antitoxin stability system
MDVSLTEFRRNIFILLKQAMNGEEIWITHNGGRFQIVPEVRASSKLSRITPLAIISSGNRAPSTKESARLLQKEMLAAWQRDWSNL